MEPNSVRFPGLLATVEVINVTQAREGNNCYVGAFVFIAAAGAGLAAVRLTWSQDRPTVLSS
jgi:hypothetical protein